MPFVANRTKLLIILRNYPNYSSAFFSLLQPSSQSAVLIGVDFFISAACATGYAASRASFSAGDGCLVCSSRAHGAPPWLICNHEQDPGDERSSA